MVSESGALPTVCPVCQSAELTRVEVEVPDAGGGGRRRVDAVKCGQCETHFASLAYVGRDKPTP
jgi:hypothetical protein